MNIRVIILTIFTVISLSSFAQEKKTNVIFIFADDWGYGDLGKHGSTFCKTPNLDRMIDEGTDFTEFVVNSPVCSPSRTAVMTGQYPARLSVHQHFATPKHHIEAGMPDWLDPKATTVQDLFKKNGYVTGHFGKWHLTNRSIKDAPTPYEYGYDDYAAFNLPGQQIQTEETVPKAIEFIEKNKKKPFFINLWLHEPHTPHFPQKQFLEQFKDLPEQQQVYAAVIAEADFYVGELFKKLRTLGLDKNTLVVFSSDNGPEHTHGEKRKYHQGNTDALGLYYCVGETGGLKGKKRSLFQGGVKVPFIAWMPGVVPAGKVDQTSVITGVDMPATFLDMAGLSIKDTKEMDGESRASVLKGKPSPRKKPVFWEWKGFHGKDYYWPHLGIRKGKWKMMMSTDHSKVELYNMELDPKEQNDLASQFPEVIVELKKEMLDWQSELPELPDPNCISDVRL
ncbi:sulfatase [Flammeovirga sp. EKP202]|uniref:sulfatase family protein n=1 Tax=Flammeovirga sp. EKP202 TaxID=2770592 RepID=UPI00165EF154|nr:sulfatase-like hydrolase/transferase [Flammeovirga sp. EKP202]MBD0400260.1 sulfatase-like hydrolase/transferase [Flammeovirga sp. EKP202]